MIYVIAFSIFFYLAEIRKSFLFLKLISGTIKNSLEYFRGVFTALSTGDRVGKLGNCDESQVPVDCSGTRRRSCLLERAFPVVIGMAPIKTEVKCEVRYVAF